MISTIVCCWRQENGVVTTSTTSLKILKNFKEHLRPISVRELGAFADDISYANNSVLIGVKDAKKIDMTGAIHQQN